MILKIFQNHQIHLQHWRRAPECPDQAKGKWKPAARTCLWHLSGKINIRGKSTLKTWIRLGNSFFSCSPSWGLPEQTKSHNFRAKPRAQLRHVRRAPFRERVVGEPQEGGEAPLGGRESEPLASCSVDPAASKDCPAWCKSSTWTCLSCLSAGILASWQIQAREY